MDVFAARQPIFDDRERVVGYGLLHRAGDTDRYTAGQRSHRAPVAGHAPT